MVRPRPPSTPPPHPRRPGPTPQPGRPRTVSQRRRMGRPSHPDARCDRPAVSRYPVDTFKRASVPHPRRSVLPDPRRRPPAREAAHSPACPAQASPRALGGGGPAGPRPIRRHNPESRLTPWPSLVTGDGQGALAMPAARSYRLRLATQRRRGCNPRHLPASSTSSASSHNHAEFQKLSLGLPMGAPPAPVPGSSSTSAATSYRPKDGIR